jgi:hypothetical protein
MREREIEKVRLFCKRAKIVGIPLSDLFDAISRKHPMTRVAFEVSMLKLNKKPALDLKLRCLKYLEIEGEHAYDKFCKEQNFVTKEFWTLATGINPDEASIDVGEIERRAERFLQAGLDAIHPAIQPRPKDIASESEQEAMQKMLPVNWMTMAFSDRVNFVKKIQHDKFRGFVLNLDPKLKKYFSVLKPKPPLKIKLYVTLFQFPAENYSTEAKNLLKGFIEILNTFGRANLQYVECTNPSVVEIREVR